MNPDKNIRNIKSSNDHSNDDRGRCAVVEYPSDTASLLAWTFGGTSSHAVSVSLGNTVRTVHNHTASHELAQVSAYRLPLAGS